MSRTLLSATLSPSLFRLLFQAHPPADSPDGENIILASIITYPMPPPALQS